MAASSPRLAKKLTIRHQCSLQAQYCRQRHKHILWTPHDYGRTFQQGKIASLILELHDIVDDTFSFIIR